MNIGADTHLTYCTNIHPGETWDEVFKSLQEYSLGIKKEFSPDKPFGIGLRLSQISAATLLKEGKLQEFKEWLLANDLYVFTMNGFPFGDFHDTVIKDNVHRPDWRTLERINYTQDLFEILTFLLPEGMEGGISTSPLSYKLWFESKEALEKVKSETCSSLMRIVVQLAEIKERTGKLLHLDLEPEPDGVLENTQEVIDFFNDYLLSEGLLEIEEKLKCTSDEARSYILTHLQVCYDVCHFALAYEKPEEVMQQFEKHGIRIGKIQISAALKCEKSSKVSVTEQQECLRQFDEPNYLHQAVVKQKDGKLKHFSDLREGILAMNAVDFEEIRTHFHVPVFVSDFQVLKATQTDIIEALELWKKTNYSKHLEVETYTWTILPENLQTDIASSVVRELEWVHEQISN